MSCASDLIRLYLLPPQMVGLGQLGKEGTGRLRLQVRTQKQKLSAKTAKRVKAYGGGAGGGPISGLSSSLAFTPIQVSSRPHQAVSSATGQSVGDRRIVVIASRQMLFCGHRTVVTVAMRRLPAAEMESCRTVSPSDWMR